MKYLHSSNRNRNKPGFSVYNVLLILSFSVLVIACVSYTNSFQSREIPTKSYTPAYLEEFEETSFLISIEAYANHFGGILAAKKITENHYRFAFLNEFGGKMIDFELIDQELKLNHAIDELNKKIILNLLKKDFNLIFHENNPVSNAYENDGFLILEGRINKRPVYYYLKNGELQKTVLTGKAKEKIQIGYRYAGRNFPEVEIIHQNLKIKIYLHLPDKT